MAGKRAKAEMFLRHLEPLQGALEAYCRRSSRDSNAVGDVLQSAVANAYRDFHLYAEGTNFRAWIFRYVHLELLNWNRRYARQSSEALPEEVVAKETDSPQLDDSLLNVLLEDPDSVLDHCEEELAQAIREMPVQERSVLLLHAIGEFKYREIAEIIEVPIGTVMSSLARARSRVRQRLIECGLERGLLAAGDG